MRIERTILFNCTAEHLWSFLDEPERQKLWMKGLLENVPTSEGVKGVGSTFRMKIKEGGKVGEYQGEVTAYDRPRHLAVRFWGGPFPKGAAMRADYRLSEQNGQTRMDYVASFECERLPFFLRLLMPLLKCFSAMQLRSFFKTLKKLVEEPTPAGTAS
jgi:uncharacterized protein YndB with AHSA1/START domain